VSDPPVENHRFRDLAPLLLLTASLSMGYGSVFTLLAEFRNRFGFSASAVGLIAGAGFFAGLVAQLSLSRQADRGHTAVLLRVGVMTAAASMLWMAVATELYQFVGARLLLGLGTGAVVPAVRRIVIKHDPDNMGENLGRVTSFDIAGFVAGPVVAAVFTELVGFKAPFVFLGIWYLALLPIVFRLSIDTTVEQSEHRVLRTLVRIRPLRAALGLAVAFYVTIGLFEALWALLLDDLGAETWLIGLTLSLFTLPMVLLAPNGGRVAQRRGPYRVAPWTIGVAAACMLAYGAAGEFADPGQTATVALIVVVVVSGIHAVADSFTMPASQLAIAQAAPAQLMASAQGLYSAVGLFVALMASVAAGGLFQHFGPLVTFAAGAVVMAGGTAYALAAHESVPGDPARVA
jgi:MFS family permease